MSSQFYPRISIVTVCFNRAQYIAETIESVLSQGYPNLEYIVIDDNSTDGSWEVIQKYKDKLAYIEQIPGKRDTPVESLNYGLSKTTGEIMATINDKNIYMPKSLFAVAGVFSAFPQVEWLTGVGLIIDKGGIITNIIPIRKGFYEHLINLPWNIQHESTFWRRSLWKRTGSQYDPKYSWVFDMGLWRKFFFEAPLYHLNTVVGAYRKLPSARTTLNKEEFYHYCALARQDMRTQAKKTDLAYAELYRALRYFKPILRNIPDAVYARIPFLKKMSHDSIAFQNVTIDDFGPGHLRFRRYKRNPFRTMFPW
ncbi:MAG: glycosyltransferase [bacterium]